MLYDVYLLCLGFSQNGYHNVEVYEGGRDSWMRHKRGRMEDNYDLPSDIVVLADASRRTEAVSLPGLVSHGAVDEGYDPERPDIFPLQRRPAPEIKPRTNPPQPPNPLSHFQPSILPDQHPRPYRDAGSSNSELAPDRPLKTRRSATPVLLLLLLLLLRSRSIPLATRPFRRLRDLAN